MKHVTNHSNRNLAAATATIVLLAAGAIHAQAPVQPVEDRPALDIQEQSVRYLEELDVLVFEQRLAGSPETAVPEPAGGLDGAPVLGYVFPTTLSPEPDGFGVIAGLLAHAGTSQPDFDLTPIRDEGVTGRYDDDGAVWHAHWVVLGKDERPAGGLSTIEFDEGDNPVLPPTNPGMALYLDSPGFNIVVRDDTLRVVVPAYRVSNNIDFRFDAVTAYMEVNTSDPDRPMLGVYKVYDVASAELSLPFEVNSSANSD